MTCSVLILGLSEWEKPQERKKKKKKNEKSNPNPLCFRIGYHPKTVFFLGFEFQSWCWSCVSNKLNRIIVFQSIFKFKFKLLPKISFFLDLEIFLFFFFSSLNFLFDFNHFLQIWSEIKVKGIKRKK